MQGDGAELDRVAHVERVERDRGVDLTARTPRLTVRGAIDAHLQHALADLLAHDREQPGEDRVDEVLDRAEHEGARAIAQQSRDRAVVGGQQLAELERRALAEGVSRTPRPSRANSGSPSCSSSRRMWRLTAGWVRCSASAARW